MAVEGVVVMTNMSVPPNKALGQHWLHDLAALTAICDGAAVGPGDVVLEVGPGLGTLTQVLLARGARVVAVEYDTQLAQSLTPRLVCEDSPCKQEAEMNLTVVEEDILRFNLQQLPRGYKVVANIPYYLTSHLLRVLCESRAPFSRAALLVQKEVAERVCAPPGVLSILAVSTQLYCEVALGPVVPASLFTPPPKVDSQVLLLHYRQRPLFDGVNHTLFLRIVKAGFSQKRKTLLNSLSGGLALTKEHTAALLHTAQIAPATRAQAVSLAEWHALYLAALSTRVMNE